MTDLTAIRLKVRRVTALPSPNQMSVVQLDEYINTFYQYDLPEHLRLINLKETFTFITEPDIDIYNFTPNTNVSIEPPVYAGGNEIQLFQDRQTYFQLYPEIQRNEVLDTGDGTTGPFAGTITGVPVKRSRVLVSTVDTNDDPQSAVDNGLGFFIITNATITGITQAAAAVITAPGHTIAVGATVHISGVFGMTQINGGPYTVTVVAGDNITINVNSTSFEAYRSGGTISIQQGTINYITGAIANLNFSAIIPLGTDIQVQSVNYQSARPQGILFYNDQFQLTPVPDQAYDIVMNTFVTPAQLVNATDEPQIREWWQLIAYGAALKIFADNLDMESHQKVSILFDEQKRLMERRTLQQLKLNRVNTIYSDDLRFPVPFSSGS